MAERDMVDAVTKTKWALGSAPSYQRKQKEYLEAVESLYEAPNRAVALSADLLLREEQQAKQTVKTAPSAKVTIPEYVTPPKLGEVGRQKAQFLTPSPTPAQTKAPAKPLSRARRVWNTFRR